MSNCSMGVLSSSKSKPNSEKNPINKGTFKFHNKVCYCRVMVAINVSESQPNPNKLYYSCRNDLASCFFKWWKTSREGIVEFARQINLLKDKGIDNSDNNIMKFVMADLDHKIIRIETLLCQLKKYQLIIMVILILLATIVYYNL